MALGTIEATTSEQFAKVHHINPLTRVFCFGLLTSVFSFVIPISANCLHVLRLGSIVCNKINTCKHLKTVKPDFPLLEQLPRVCVCLPLCCPISVYVQGWRFKAVRCALEREPTKSANGKRAL